MNGNLSRAAGALAACIFLAAGALPAMAQSTKDLGPKPPGQFDYYVLSLSWVPGYCATHRDPGECGKGLTFALHGLWPQDTNGYPSDCSQVALTADEQRTYAGVYASPSLIVHEWSKHGVCSGLAPAAYFGLAAADVKQVAIPKTYTGATKLPASDAASVKQAFIAANPGMTGNGVKVVTVKAGVTEVDICLTKADAKAGGFRGC
jgi:ribonuclease T2